MERIAGDREMTQQEKTLVVFRKWKDNGDIIALFPEIPSDLLGYFCLSYERVGQHGGADYHGVIRATKPVGRNEVAQLKKELTRIGYRLLVRKRASAGVHSARMADASNAR
jgi:hypothetical protein